VGKGIEGGVKGRAWLGGDWGVIVHQTMALKIRPTSSSPNQGLPKTHSIHQDALNKVGKPTRRKGGGLKILPRRF
jgi:hypothetical protein